MWNKVEPFRNKKAQRACELHESREGILQQYESLNKYGEYPVQFIATVLELLMIQEKTGNVKAHMFKGVLDAIHEDKDIFSIVSAATFGGRR